MTTHANDTSTSEPVRKLIGLPIDEVRRLLLRGAMSLRTGVEDPGAPALADLLEATEVHIHGLLADTGVLRDDVHAARILLLAAMKEKDRFRSTGLLLRSSAMLENAINESDPRPDESPG